MKNKIIQLKNLGYSYPDGTEALKEISFSVESGESLALAGENGAGKSTLLMHFTGCLLPSSGELFIGGIKARQSDLPHLRRKVGMVFQNPDDQLFMPTVFDDVAFGIINMGIPKEAIDSVVVRALETVGIAHLKNRPPFKLSQGEKRSAAIAGVIAMEPEILVMDEPTSGLDPKSRRRLINLLKTFGHTKIIATHDLDFAMEVCKRAVILHKGRVTADGPAAEIFRNAEIMERSSLELPLSLNRNTAS